MATSVKVSHRVKAMLKERKTELGAKSVDDVLERLLLDSQDERGAGGVAGAARKRARLAEDEEENEKVPQLLSYEILVREPAALKWFTGMKEAALNWTMIALRDAVTICSRFCAFASPDHSARDRQLIGPPLICSSNITLQLKKNTQTPEGVKQKSNKGHRKLLLDDRILLYLVRKWRGIPFEGLRILFGVSFGTAVNCFNETLKAYNDHVTRRLLYPRSADEIDGMTPADFKQDLPGARLIFDGTGLEMKNKENVLLHRILFSAYHKQTEGQVVFGEWVLALAIECHARVCINTLL
jgi:hypothetical protein